MLIEFVRVDGGSTVATIHRRDGVVVELHGYDRKHRVPHDLAHAVTERELGLADGVFGSIAGGVMFKSMRVVDGRPRYDAAERSRRILAANGGALTTAEVMAGIVHDAVEYAGGGRASAQGRIDWGIVRPDPHPWTDEQIGGAIRALTDLMTVWERDGRIQLTWPDRLTSTASAQPGVKRSRTGRT
jgi:hypothetical protein